MNDWKLTAQVTYVVFSTLTGVLCYVIVRNLFGARTAREALIIVICLPSLTAAVAGWAHKEVVTLLFMYLTAHGFWTLLSRPTIAAVIATAAAAAVTVVLRTDAILYLLVFSGLSVAHIGGLQERRQKVRHAIGLGVVTATVLSGLVLNYQFVLRRTNSVDTVRLFGDARYAYDTYVTTNMLRVQAPAESPNDEIASAAFGSAAANQYSIVKAIRRNPKEAARNLLFNLKTLLQEAAHPLLVPVFLYPFVGLALLLPSARAKWKEHLFLAAFVPPCLTTILVFHLEMRYMIPLSLPVAAWAALGIEQLDFRTRRLVRPAVYLLLVALFVAYAFHFRSVYQTHPWRTL